MKDEDPTPSRWRVGAALLGGCLASGILGLLAVAWWIYLAETGLAPTTRRASAIVFVSALILIALVGYRASRSKKDISLELGLIVGLSLIALSSGLCALPGRF